MTEKEAFLKFYREIQAWIDGGEKPEWFDPTGGLCSNLTLFYVHNAPGIFLSNLRSSMSVEFARRGLDLRFPFDTGYSAYAASNKYRNPNRLAWIKEHAQ